MVRVLLVGYDPEAVDYSDPALPPGMNAEKIRAGITLAMKQVTDRGWQGDLCLIRPDPRRRSTCCSYRGVMRPAQRGDAAVAALSGEATIGLQHPRCRPAAC